MRTLALIVALSLTASLAVCAQPLRLPDSPTPQQAYKPLLSVGCFAFGGVGYAGVTSDGERAYRSIACSTNALALFSAAVTNGNAQTKLYALCGIRQFAPRTFDTNAKPLLIANPRVKTMSGCILRSESTSNVVARIASGFYDTYFKSPKH